MHILHIIDELKVGGQQRLLYTLLQKLPFAYKSRHTVACLFKSGDYAEKIRSLGIQVDLLHMEDLINSRHYLKAISKLTAYIKSNGPDLVESQLTWSRLLGLPASQLAGVKKRYAIEPGDIYFNSFKWRAFNFAGQVFANKLIVCSDALGEWVHRTHGVSKRRLITIHNGINPDSFKVSHNSTNRAHIGLSEKDFVLCTVGTLGSGVNKRTDFLIDCMKDLKNVHRHIKLLVIGDGNLRHGLQKKLDNERLQNEVIFLGTRDDIPDLLQLSDLFVHAAPFEPFGIVCLEAMLMKLPVLVPNTGGIPEVVTHGQTGFTYQSLDPEDFLRKIEPLLKDKDLREQIALNAHKEVLKRFTIDVYVEKIAALYGLEKK